MAENILMQKAGGMLMKAVNAAAGKDFKSIVAFVDTIRINNPELSNRELAGKIVRKKSWFAGIAGGVYGAGGMITIAPDLFTMWRIQGRLIMAVAHIFGHDLDLPERKEEILLVMGIAFGSEAAKKVALEAGKEGMKHFLLAPAVRAVIEKLPEKIITVAGEKSLLNVGKLVPLVGIPVGFLMDFISTRAIGKAAIEYYS